MVDFYSKKKDNFRVFVKKKKKKNAVSGKIFVRIIIHTLFIKTVAENTIINRYNNEYTS